MKKLIYGILLSLLLALGVRPYVITSAFEKGEYCTVKLSVENNNIDLSTVVIDVYSAECTYSEPEIGAYYYSEYYDHSVNVDANGFASIEKPSENFLVSVKMETLPDGYGVLSNSYFFQAGTKECIFELKEISNVEINKDIPYSVKNTTDNISCFDENGQILFTKTKIVKKEYNLINSSSITNDAERDLLLEYVYNVKAGGKEYIVNKEYSLHCPNKESKAESLYKLKLISEHDYMNMLASYMLYGDEYKDEDNEIECGTSEYMILYNYREKHNDKEADYSLIDKVLNRSNPLFDSTRAITYLDSPSGKFRVYYDTSNTNYNYNDVYNMGLLFDDIDNYFCVTLGYTRPFNPSTTKYLIYLVTSFTGTASGNAYACTVYSGGTSHIEIKDTYVRNIATGMGLSGYPNRYKGGAAHEYMHAIMYAKGILNETWLHESFASWAGIQYAFDYRVIRSVSVRNFLLTSSQSLETVNTSNNRHYGSCVFPLYISNNLGVNVIKQIVNSYSSSSGALAAVVSGLSYYSSNLADAFAECAAYNYDADYFYSTGLTGTGDAWGGVNPSIYNTYPNSTSYTMNHLSAYYIQYDPAFAPKQLTVNISFQNPLGVLVPRIRAVRTNSSGQKYVGYPTINSNQCTILINSFGDLNFAHYTVIPVNAGILGNLPFTAYAQVN